MLERIPLSEIATGPKDEDGIGPKFREHSKLESVVTGLEYFPGMGLLLVHVNGGTCSGGAPTQEAAPSAALRAPRPAGIIAPSIVRGASGMKVRRAHLGMIAFAGGNMVSLVLTFLRDITVIFGSVWTAVILIASIMAMVPFIVSQFVHGFQETGVRGLLGEAAFAFMVLAVFALALFLVHPEPDAIGKYEIVAFAVPVSVLCVAWIRYRDRATRVKRAGTAQRLEA